jgi:putative FmdB family regulatory protein
LPIYVYECETCEERFEMRRSMSDSDADIKCPNCGAEHPRRVLASFSTASGGSCAPGAST